MSESYDNFSELAEIDDNGVISEKDIIHHISMGLPISKDKNGKFFIEPLDEFWPDDDAVYPNQDMIESMIERKKLIPVTLYIPSEK